VLDQELETKPFPLDALPPLLAKFIREVSRVQKLPVELVAGQVLGVLSASVMRGLFSKILPGKITYGNIFVLIFARSGLGKSETLRVCKQPILDLDLEEQEDWKSTKLPELKNEIPRLEEEKKELEGDLKSDMAPEEKEITRRQLVQTEIRLDELKKQLTAPRLLVEDITIQKLGAFMQLNNECASIITDDGGAVLNNILGRYNPQKQVEDTLYLKGYSVMPHVEDRQTRETVILNKPCLSILLMTQTNKIGILTKNTQLMEGGFLPRWAIIPWLQSSPARHVARANLAGLPSQPASCFRYTRQ
jgi:hypothetical protein